MAFFQNSVLQTYLKGLDKSEVKTAFDKYVAYFHNPERQENIRNSKEEQFQEGFLTNLFVKILGYTLIPEPGFNLTTELKNETGSKKADGAILKDGKAIGVIELKGTDTKDLSKINAQAFNYKNNQTNCIYVITSNFEKLRFFIHNSVDHLEFNLFTLTEDDFNVLWLCLQNKNLLNDIPLNIKNESLQEEEKVTKRLYKDYASFRTDLWQNMVKNNTKLDKLLLFKKTQKLLDRFLFIFFGEDSGLLPPNSISRIVNRWEVLKEADNYKTLYEIFKQYFEYINKGRKGKMPIDDIFAYNGGLFQQDELLDKIVIEDDILLPHVSTLTKYDFQSEVDVNILGHIFENSLNEIENITAELEGQEIDKSNTKRKKDGVFYTPKYITKYIVENTLGKLCEEKKTELEINTIDFTKNYLLKSARNATKETEVITAKGIAQNITKIKTKLSVEGSAILDKLEQYRSYLLGLTICDPACGSGAFLNQALEFLIKEHQQVDEMISALNRHSFVFPDIENHILEQNLFGVDINEESVEIARLSLWLRTAQRGRKLTTLNNNIKCGNSLIDDPKFAGEKAFNWKKEFPTVFDKGGFDCVIGNPPYGILIDKKTQEYYVEYFPLTQYKTNLYILFIERMLQIFNKGIIHFIIPKSLLFNSYYEDIRKELLKKTEINEIFTITEKVFEDAEVGSSLLLQFMIKEKPNQKNIVRLAEADTVQNFITGIGLVENKVSQDFFLSVPNCEISVVSSDSQSILKKLHKLKSINQNYTLKNGLNPGNIKHILIAETKETDKHKPIIWGKDISRYNILWSGQYINYDESIGDRISIDDIKSKDGMNKQNRIDFALRSPELFERRKIVVRKTGDSLIGSIDENKNYFDTLVHGIYENENESCLEYLLAILNSNPATKFYRLLHDIKGKVFAKISLDNLASFPIPECKQSEKDLLIEKAKFLLNKVSKFDIIRTQFSALIQSKIEKEKLSTKLQNWHELNFKDFLKEVKKSKIKLSLSDEAKWMQYFNEQKQIALTLKTEIDKTDKEIDHMVYELYGLTEEEIKIVEGS